MYKSFSVTNFRLFQDLDIHSLKRVNLIAGKNNSGKTALLEALFWHVGVRNPELPLILARARGMANLKASDNIGWLFRSTGNSHSIRLEGKDTAGKTRSVDIRNLSQDELQEVMTEKQRPPSLGGPLTTEADLFGLIAQYSDSEGGSGFSRIIAAPNDEMWFKTENIPPQPNATLIAPNQRFLKENTVQLSELERKRQAEPVLEALRKVEPRLQRLLVLDTASEPTIWGDIGTADLLPIHVMGDGLNRILSIILVILKSQNGIVLIDEIESGLHYTVMQDMWMWVAKFAKQNNVQVFATTHSGECIEAARLAFSSQPKYDFSYHRLSLIQERVNVVTYDQRKLEIASKSDLEVR